MIDDDLISKFDSIEDLPISEEMLGAYLEGNLDYFDLSVIESMVEINHSLKELIPELDLNDSFSETLQNIDSFTSDEKFKGSNFSLPIIEDLFYDNNATLENDFLKELFSGENSSQHVNFERDDFSEISTEENKLYHNDSFSGEDQSLNTDSNYDEDLFNDNAINS